MGSHVVGFDTIGYYVPTTLSWLQNGVGFWNFIAAAPFLYTLLMGLTSVGIPITISLKIMSPLLLGILGAAVYFYANKTLSWSSKKSLLVVLFATLYFVALRVSWDMLRTEIGLIFLFVTLIFLKKNVSSLINGMLLSLVMLLVVFAHPLVALIMFVVVLATLVHLGFDRQMGAVRRLAVCTTPAILLFSIIVYANYVVFPQFSAVSGFLGQSSEGYMALYSFGSYSNLVIDTMSFLIYCYLPLVPLLVLGARRLRNSLQLKAWILCVSVALALAFVNIFVAILPYRWILLLTYPLAFYAAEGLAVIKSNAYKLGIGLIIATLSVGFIALPSNIAFPYYTAFPLYTPRSMLENTLSLSDCQDTVNVLQWAKTNIDNSTRLLVHRVFYGWALLFLNSDQLIPYDYNDPVKIAQTLLGNSSQYQLCLVWWVNGTAVYHQPNVYSAFGKEMYESGRIAIFAYNVDAYFSIPDSSCQTSIKSCSLF
jgi:hypothetical protein